MPRARGDRKGDGTVTDFVDPLEEPFAQDRDPRPPLDPDVEQGGAIRLLSRLHSELPRVPFLSGWVDPERAVPLAERALAEYPQHPGNFYLLGLALLSHAPERREEGLSLVEATAALAPRADHVVEDLAIREDAQRRLIAELGVPTYELPRLPGGVDLGGLYELAALLKAEGMA